MNLSDTIWKQKEEKQIKHLLNKIHLYISNLGFTPGRIECVIRVDLLKVTLILFLPSKTSTADMSHTVIQSSHFCVKVMVGIFIILVTFYNGRKMCEDSSLPRVIKTSFLDVLDFNVFMNKKGFRIYVGQSFIRPQSSFKLPLVFDH